MADQLPARGGENVLPQNDFIEGLANMNVLRQLGVMLGLAAAIALAVGAVLWFQEADYRPLYGSLDRLDSSEVLKTLDTYGIAHKVDPNSGALLVDAKKIHEARLKLAEIGIPNDRSQGFELLTQEQPLGTSQFMENARYLRSLEGELARTIGSIHSVRAARVHLAIPKRTVFLRDQQRTSASVFLELFPGRSVSPEQVRGVTNLVASSIPELKVEDVTVVDQKGHLLSGVLKEDPEVAAANRQLDYARKLEETLSRRIASILEPLVGPGKYRAEVAADVDFTQMEQTDELFNPELPAVRSEQTSVETRSGTEGVAGIPGALSNQPPETGAAPAVAGPGAGAAVVEDSARSRRQVMRNYELDRTISHTRHQVGRLRRLSVAVLVDDLQQPGADGKTMETIPWPQEELDRLTVLVRDAVGFDAARGDSVNVINSRFLPQEKIDFVPEEVPLWQQPWVLQWAKPVLSFLVVMAVLFGVVRPVIKSIGQGARESRELDAQRSLGDLGGGAAGGGERGAQGQVTLAGPGGMMLPGPEDNYEQQLTAIKGLVAEDPGRVAQVMKKWVASGE
jgi:flagellar M-ring protein FliF